MPQRLGSEPRWLVQSPQQQQQQDAPPESSPQGAMEPWGGGRRFQGGQWAGRGGGRLQRAGPKRHAGICSRRSSCWRSAPALLELLLLQWSCGVGGGATCPAAPSLPPRLGLVPRALAPCPPALHPKDSSPAVVGRIPGGDPCSLIGRLSRTPPPRGTRAVPPPLSAGCTQLTPPAATGAMSQQGGGRWARSPSRLVPRRPGAPERPPAPPPPSPQASAAGRTTV